MVSHYEKIIRDLKAGERAATQSADRQEIKSSISLYKQQMMEELNALDDGKEPLEAAVEAYDKARTFSEKNKLRMRIERLTMRQSGEKPKTSGRSADVEKALSYTVDEERESRKTDEKYLALATAENVRDDARIKAAKVKIKPYVDEYKQMMADGRQERAGQYRQKHLNYFAAQQRIEQLSRAMNANKKLLGNGNDRFILKMIDSQRRQMLKAVEEIE